MHEYIFGSQLTISVVMYRRRQAMFVRLADAGKRYHRPAAMMRPASDGASSVDCATLTLASGLFSSIPISIEVWVGIVFIVLGSFSQVVYSLPLAIGLWKNRLWAVVMAFIVHILHLFFNFFGLLALARRL